MAILNYDKKKLLEQEIKDINEKMEQFRQDLIQEAKRNGTYGPGIELLNNKELIKIYNQMISHRTKKEEELDLLIKEMLSNGEGLHDPIDIARQKLERVEANNESIDILKSVISQTEQTGEDIKRLMGLGEIDSRMFYSSIQDLKALKFNCEVGLRQLKRLDKKTIEKEIKDEEEKRNLKLKELEEKDITILKYKSIY